MGQGREPVVAMKAESSQYAMPVDEAVGEKRDRLFGGLSGDGNFPNCWRIRPCGPAGKRSAGTSFSGNPPMTCATAAICAATAAITTRATSSSPGKTAIRRRGGHSCARKRRAASPMSFWPGPNLPWFPSFWHVCFAEMPLGCIATNGVRRIDPAVGYRIHISVWGNDETSCRVRKAKDLLDRQIENYRGDPRAVFVYTFTRENIDEISDVMAPWRPRTAGSPSTSFPRLSVTRDRCVTTRPLWPARGR